MITYQGDDLNTVIGIFERLRTADERTTLYVPESTVGPPDSNCCSIQSILRSLPREHVRELACHAGAIHFRFDIVGNLPIEILCLIFQDLPIYQAFQLRRVSKTWHQKLSAPELVESMLQPWFAMGDVDLRMPQDASTAEALAIRAEHVDAFKTGNPFSMVQGQWDVDWDEGYKHRPTNIDYSNGRVAWAVPEDTGIHVRNLEFGQETLYTPPNRERISKISLSRGILAATTDSGRCYVWDCTTGALYTIQLPSSRITLLATSNKTLTILHHFDARNEFEVTTWNLDDCRTRSFQVAMQDRSWAQSEVLTYELHVTDDSFSFIEYDMGPPDQIFFTRYTLEGKVIANGTTGLLHRTFRSGVISTIIYPPEHCSFSVFCQELDRVKVKDEEPRFMILRKRVVDATRGIVRIQYNLRNDRLESLNKKVIPSEEFEISNNDANSWYFWKDAAFRFAYDGDDDRPSSAAFDLRSGTRTNMYMHDEQNEIGPPRVRRRQLHHGGSSGTEAVRFFGDEMYMIRMSSRGYTAYCFDKHITMAGEDKDFRQQRVAARLERIRRRDQARPGTSIRTQATGQTSIDDLEAELAQHEQELWARQQARASRLPNGKDNEDDHADGNEGNDGEESGD